VLARIRRGVRGGAGQAGHPPPRHRPQRCGGEESARGGSQEAAGNPPRPRRGIRFRDRKSTRLNSSHLVISYAVFCLKKKIFTTAFGARIWYRPPVLGERLRPYRDHNHGREDPARLDQSTPGSVCFPCLFRTSLGLFTAHNQFPPPRKSHRCERMCAILSCSSSLGITAGG